MSAICYACRKRIHIYVPKGGEGMIFRLHRKASDTVRPEYCENSHGPVDMKQDFVKR